MGGASAPILSCGRGFSPDFALWEGLQPRFCPVGGAFQPRFCPVGGASAPMCACPIPAGSLRPWLFPIPAGSLRPWLPPIPAGSLRPWLRGTKRWIRRLRSANSPVSLMKAGVAELVDAGDLKSSERKLVRVQVPPSALVMKSRSYVVVLLCGRGWGNLLGHSMVTA